MLPHRWDHLGARGAGRVDMINVGGDRVNGGPRIELVGAGGEPASQVSDVMGDAARAL